MLRIYVFPWNIDSKKFFPNESNKCKINKHKTFYVQNKYFHRIEALKRLK